jgi:hypothetical protein
VNQGLAILFLGLAGFSLGGAWSLRQQGKPAGVQAAAVTAGVVFLVVGGLYLASSR